MSTTLVKNLTNTVLNINDIGITLAPNEIIDIYEFREIVDLTRSNDTIKLITNDKIVINNGFTDLDKSGSIRHITGHTIASVYDVSGKIRVHQTSRKLGLRIMWSGTGDDTSNIHSVGGGTPIIANHEIGDPQQQNVYIDYNIVTNETWLHEGYVTWKDCNMDTISLEMVPRVTPIESGVNTNYNLYGGYMVIPAAGNGNINVTADITNPNNGLIEMPINDLQEPAVAFWNADYNSTTKLYENISPAPLGNGRYNMFTIEVVFARFVNKMPLLGNGFIALNSSDTDRVGHGMRLKLVTTTSSEDHKWSLACLMCLHRLRSV